MNAPLMMYSMLQVLPSVLSHITGSNISNACSQAATALRSVREQLQRRDDSDNRREAAELEQHTNSAPYLSGSKKRRRVVISIHSHLQKRENGKPGRQNLYVWQTKTSVKFPALLMKRRSLLMLVWVKEPSAYQY